MESSPETIGVLAVSVALLAKVIADMIKGNGKMDIMKDLEAIRARLDETVSLCRSIYDMHNVRDEKGRYVWYYYAVVERMERLLSRFEERLRGWRDGD